MKGREKNGTTTTDGTTATSCAQAQSRRVPEVAEVSGVPSRGRPVDSPRRLVPSGVDWIGDVPEGWKVERLKYLLKVPLFYGASESGDDFDEDMPRYIRITDITNDGMLRDDGRLSLSREKAEPYLLQNKDILLARSGATAGKGFYYLASYGESAFAGYLICCRLSEISSDQRFVFYAMQGHAYDQWKSSVVIQATIPNISAEKYSNYKICLPPLPEQRAIAARLDAVCGKIDALKAKIEKEIAALEEYRKSLITKCVTKGLGSNDGSVIATNAATATNATKNAQAPGRRVPEVAEVPSVPCRGRPVDRPRRLVPSGVDWIGDVPEGWEVPKLKYLVSKIGSGKTPTGGANSYPDEGVIFLRSQNIYDEGLHLEDVEHISELTDSEMANTRVKKDDVLLNITGGSIGRCCIYNLDESANVNQHVCIIRSTGELLPRYLHYYLNGYAEHIVNDNQQGGNRESLNFEQIGNLELLFPPLPEQHEIADYLDKKCAAIDAVVAKRRKQLDGLTEYRKSVIYSYVTGKKEVAA